MKGQSITLAGPQGPKVDYEGRNIEFNTNMWLSRWQILRGGRLEALGCIRLSRY